MKQISTTAVILRRVNYGEADRILTVLTPDKGQVSLLAKGVRRSKSKLAGSLELLSETKVGYIDGRSNLKTVTSAQLVTHFSVVAKDLVMTTAAFNFIKQVDRYTQHDVDSQAYYRVLLKVLQTLDSREVDANAVFLWGYMQLLRLSGAGVNLERPLNAEKFEEDGHYRLSYEDMAFLADENGPATAKVIKFLRLVSRADDPAKLRVISGYEALSEQFASVASELVRYSNA